MTTRLAHISPLTESGTAPLYTRIHEQMKSLMQSGQWKLDSALPSEETLARDFGVSLGTMRKAMDALVTEGWAVRKRGRGTFLADLALVRADKMSRFEQQGCKLIFRDEHIAHLAHRRIAPAPKERKEFQIQGDQYLLEIDRCICIPSVMTLLEKVVVPEHLCPELADQMPFPKQLQMVLAREYDLIVEHSSETLWPANADADVAAKLGVAVGHALLCTERTDFDVNGQMIMLIRRWVAAVDARYSVDLL